MLELMVIIRVEDPALTTNVADALVRLRRAVLAEPGCLSWEAMQSESDPTRIVLYEQWASREAWEAHDALSGIQEIYIPDVLPYVSREVHVMNRLGSPDAE